MGSSDNAAALGCQEQRGYRRAAGALERHEGSVDSVPFSPDDTRIVSASGADASAVADQSGEVLSVLSDLL